MKKLKRDGYIGSVDRLTTEFIAKNTVKPMKVDVANRMKVQQKILKYMDMGLTNEEAVDMVMKNEKIIEQFSYLEKNG